MDAERYGDSIYWVWDKLQPQYALKPHGRFKDGVPIARGSVTIEAVAGHVIHIHLVDAPSADVTLHRDKITIEREVE